MKSFELHGYRPRPVCDMHVHPHVEAPLDESEAVFRSVMEYFRDERIVLEALPCYDTINNFKALYFKSRIGGVYADLGLIHHYDERDTADYYLDQVKAFYAMGCDGIKMLDGKPDCRKQLGRPLNDPVFDPFYAFCEEKGLPIVLHYGDPRDFWDPERIPQWALKRGWLYDSSFVSFEEGQNEVLGILEKFPRLKLILAHFFFVSDDYDTACRIMETWQNVCFDLTPGTEMYVNFNADAQKWRDFFVRYADRILYGTDTYNWRQLDKPIEAGYSHAVNLVRSFLERTEPFTDKWTGREFTHPFGLDDATLDKIYTGNFVRMFGEKPRALNGERICAEGEKFPKKYPLDDRQAETLRQIIAHFK